MLELHSDNRPLGESSYTPAKFEMATQVIMIDGIAEIFKFQRPLAWQWEDGGSSFAQSYHYFCPVCREIWAESEVLDIAHGKFRPDYTHALTHPCVKHPINRWNVAGSLFVRWGPHVRPPIVSSQDPVLMDYLPEALLAREVELHLKHEERYQNGG